jgi:hypothetical protein
MTALAAIRTHQWGEDEARLLGQLRAALGDNVAVVFHNRPAGLNPPVPVVDINDAWVTSHGLRLVSDWGWRCGDYFLYALRAARPDARHYWIVEPDVYFSGPVAQFFTTAAGLDHDLLAAGIARMPAHHRFARGMPGADHWRAIYALTRVSARALDRLLAARQALAGHRRAERFYVNDEIFTHTTVAAADDLTAGDLAALMPDWFAGTTLRTDPDILLDTLLSRTEPGVFHPVRGRASFIASVAKRIANKAGFLDGMSPSLAALTPREVEVLVAEAGRRLADAIREAAARHAPAEGDRLTVGALDASPVR